MLAEGARLEKMPLDDPVSAHQALISAYSRTKAAPAFVEPTFGKGLRGSVQRAKVDQEDAEDLKDWVAKYGRHLQQIMAELEVTDRALRSNPSFEAAKLAARHGAPAVESEIPAYEARMAAKVQKAQLEQRPNNICKGVQLAIHHGHLPGDEDTLEEVAAILVLPQFQHSQDKLGDLQRAAKIAQHPDHVRITPSKGGKSKRDAGSLSLSGGSPGPGQGNALVDRDKGKRSTRAAIQEAMAPGSSRQNSRYVGDRGTGSVRDAIARVRGAM